MMTVLTASPSARLVESPACAGTKRPLRARFAAIARRPATLGLLLAMAVLFSYWDGLEAPFVLDDEASIIGNPTLRTLWPISAPFSPPRGGGLTVEGRPILNFSLALNHVLGGPKPFGFRVTNVAIHIAAGLLLFGLTHRTLSSSACTPASGANSDGTDASSFGAFVFAACWTLHPLQTESVTYVIQRAESLCGFFYILALYAFVRGVAPQPKNAAQAAVPQRTRGWLALSVVACLLGMGTKEVMISAPLIVFLFDRTFFAGSFHAAWRLRRNYYLSLGLTWILLFALVFGFDSRGGSVGFGSGVSPWHYALTQCGAIVRYLQLAIWPYPLVFDYGTAVVTRLSSVLPQALVVLTLLAATVFALRRFPKLGFFGALFFALLAPSSSFIPVVTQTIAEHRMYLPLAAVLGFFGWLAATSLPPRTGWLAALLLPVAAFATAQRVATYRDPLVLWQDTVAKRPENTRARNNLGLLLRERRQFSDALVHFEAALRLEPSSLPIRNNYANALADLRRFEPALAEINGVIGAAPTLAEAYDTKADILRAMGRNAEAEENYAHAIGLKPELARKAAE